MNDLTKNKPLLIGVVIALIVALIIGLIIGWALNNRNASKNIAGEESALEQDANGTPNNSETVAPVSGDVRIPEAGEEQQGNVAVPELVSEAAPGIDAKFRKFEMSIGSNGFSPAEVIARQGDTVRITFSSTGGDYVIVQPDYGFKTKEVTPSNSQILEFGATTPGKYTFYCESCGGPDKGPKGFITVVPNQ